MNILKRMQNNNWKQIFADISQDDGPYEMGTVNYYKLTSILEDLYEKIKVLEDENISLTNELYRLENSLDARIDILADKFGCINDV
jgi:hypothetical protein